IMARLYCVVVVLLLLVGSSRFGEGDSNPGFMVRITRKGLEYARQYAIATLKKELAAIPLPDFSGSYTVSWVGWVNHDFHSLQIHDFVLQNSALSLLPPRGIRASLSNNYIFMGGNWKVKKAFM
uniref:Bactericidal permeability-increasing protein n=1 Tax=Castor canadensis TaxID=51338 RepID=A0A8C0W229_CASCN